MRAIKFMATQRQPLKANNQVNNPPRISARTPRAMNSFLRSGSSSVVSSSSRAPLGSLIGGGTGSGVGADGGPGSGTGILLAGTPGQAVRAAAGGRVVYSGGGLIGYGQLIIVKHNDTYLSAYGHNSSLLVEEGDNINKGQRIATMGEGPGQEPRLHFEIRRNGKPVNPRQYLPAR